MDLRYLRGNVWTADLQGYPQSSIQAGFRPVIIINSYQGLVTNDIVTVVPCTTKNKDVEVNVKLESSVFNTQSFALTNQLTTIPRRNLKTYIGRLDDLTILAVEKGILISLGIAKATTSSVQATQEALANAKKDRAELERLIPEAKTLIQQLSALVQKVDLGKPKKTARSNDTAEKRSYNRRSPEEIRAFIMEWEDPNNSYHDIIKAFGFSSVTAARQFYNRHKKN